MGDGIVWPPEGTSFPKIEYLYRMLDLNLLLDLHLHLKFGNVSSSSSSSSKKREELIDFENESLYPACDIIQHRPNEPPAAKICHL